MLARLLLLPTCLAAFTSSAVAADSTSTDDPVQLSPFVVNATSDRGYYATNSISGTKINTSLMDLPLTMQVFTEEFLRDIEAFDIADVFVYASNVSSGNAPATFDGETNQPFMRGMQGGLVQRNGNRRLRVAAAANMERVEVLKGPSSVLYGQIEPGGIVNYITKRPTPRRRVSVNQQIGSYETFRTVLDANLPLIADKLGFRLIGMTSDADSSIDYMHTRVYQINPVLTWWIRPKTQLTVEFDRTSRDVQGQRIGLPQDAAGLLNYTAFPWAGNIDRHFNMAHPDGWFEEAIDLYSADFSSEIAPWLSVRANYTRATREGSKQRIGATNIAGANRNLLNRSGTRQDVRQPESWLQLNALNTFKLGPIRVKNLIGYEDKWDEFQNNLTASAPGSNQPQWNLDDPSTWNQIMPVFPTQWTIAATTGRRVRSETSAYFFTSQISAFEERVVVLGGVRRDDVRATTTDVGKTPVVSQYPLSSTPQAGIVLKPLPGISFYASYAESFVPQFAGQKQRPDTSYFTPDPFTGEGLDIGVKFELLDSRIAGSVTWFELENTNQLQQLPNQIDPATGEQFTPWLQNGATDRSTGIETDLRLMPFKGTQVVLGYGHMRAYHKLDATRPTLVGLPLPDAPRDTFSLWVKQNLGKVGRIDNLALTGGVRYVGERPAGLVVGAWRMDSYLVATLGINGRVRIGKIDYNASLSCRNLFDELYRENVHMFGEPRTVTLTVGVSF